MEYSILDSTVLEIETPNAMRSSKRIKSSSLSSSSMFRQTSSRNASKDNEKSESQEEEYEVEAIVACRVVRGRKEYLLKWKGYPA